ncbi:MAG TPA: S46 family peptidase [Thermoanaerobaculia bacterium]|nr:S46 family peptidase [Thermoanaerobaculia bacterium]
MKRALCTLLFLATNVFAAEGKWTPQQVLELDPAWLKKQGLELAPSRLWDPQRGTGLLAGTINVGGCSGGFISADGLFITNHHCLFSILQEHATPQNDIITNGYLARTREQELRGKTMRLTMPKRFVDVTKDVLAAVPPNASDLDRYHAIDRKVNAIVAECEKQPNARCKVAIHDGGVQYVLQETSELADVRLVYAPPRSVGEYGGEIDNWMWPRHTGDFAIGRAYLDGKPFKPEFFFPISAKGIKPNDFVMVLGYPGITYRSLTANEMSERRDFYFQSRRDVYAEWLRLMEETTKGNPEGRLAVADWEKTLANRQKNADGQLVGFARGHLLEKQQAADDAVLAWAKTKSPDAVAAYDGLTKLAEEKKRTFAHDFLLEHVQRTQASLSPTGPKALLWGVTVARAAIERPKADGDRDAMYMQRNVARVRDSLEREQKSWFAATDKAILRSWLEHSQKLPADQRIAAADAIAPNLDAILTQTKIFDLAERMKMFDETEEQLRARHDPLVDAGFALDRELREMNERRERWEGTVLRLRPVWRRAVIAHAGKPVAPDANSTLRVSFAHVKGYQPRDGVWYTPQTTLAGVLEKDTGEEPFNAPKAILAAAARAGNTPVAFLADADTTGGNSGSPTVNGRGELVGVNFDRVWENVANDFGYNPEVGRNINVDVRYLLWILADVEHADALLRELGVRP